jgi:hypothetical protein
MNSENIQKKLNIKLKELSALFAESKSVPDKLEEEIHLLQLEINPRDMDTLYKLIACYFRQEQLPIPDTSKFIGDHVPNISSLQELQSLENQLKNATLNFDALSVFVAVWGMILQYPRYAFGLSKLAFILAERGHLVESYLVIQNVISRRPLSEKTINSLLEASCIVATYHPWNANKLLEDLIASTEINISNNFYFMEISRIACNFIYCNNNLNILNNINTDYPYSYYDNDEIRLLAKLFFGAGELQKSYDLLNYTLKNDQGNTVRNIIQTFSSSFGHIIDSLHKQDEIQTFLNSNYEPDCNLISPWPSLESFHNTKISHVIAIDRGLPPFCLVSSGKSASVSVCNLISSGFNLPTMVHSIVPNALIPSWVSKFALGGAVCSSHLVASKENIALLESLGLKIFLMVRDPRQMVVSFAHHLANYSFQFSSTPVWNEITKKPFHERINFLIDEYLPNVVKWINDWLSSKDRLDIHLLSFEKYINFPNLFLEELLFHYGGDQGYFNRDNALSASGIDNHFRNGFTEEWKSVLTNIQISRMNNIIGNKVFTSLCLN